MAQLPVSAAVLIRAAAAGALAALVSGCLFYHPPSQKEALARALPRGTAVPPSYAAPHARGEVANDWLASFDDPGMRAVVEEAIARNLDLREAAASVQVARQTVALVSAALWPHLGVNVSGSRTWNFTDDRTITTHGEYAELGWELDVWGQLRAQRQAAQAEYQAAALDYAFARQSLAATTAKSWYLTVTTRQLVALAESAVRIYGGIAELVHERRLAGRVADLDVAEVDASVHGAEANLRATQALELRARRGLQLLIGRYPDAEIATAPEFPPAPPPIEAGLPSSLLERRPDLVAAERSVVAAFRSHEAAELALLPQFTFGLDGGHRDDHILSLVDLNPWTLHGSIGVEIPVWEGGARIANIRIKTAEQSQAVSSYGKAVLRAFTEVETLLSNETLLAEQLRFEQRALDERSNAVRIAREQYRAGRTSLLSVLQLQRYALATEQQVIELRGAQLSNRIDLHLAVGGSFDATPATTLPLKP
jgi:multidrug efflux system outer membrane protein